MADKKIKVEANVTTKHNVSSGIGKGFGLVIGIFLALIVIAVSCSVLISSNADKIEEVADKAVQDYEQEVEKETQKAEEQLDQFIDEITPIDEKAKEKDEEFTFSPNSLVATQNGISLSLDDFKYEIKGGTWGKITEMTVTVLNKGNNNLQPKVLVLLYDEKDPAEETVKTKAEIEFDMFGLGVGEHVTKKAVTNIVFNDIDLPKMLKVVLVNAYDFDNRAMVVVEKEFMAE